MEKKKSVYVSPEVRVRMMGGVEMLCGSGDAYRGAVHGEDDVFGGSFGASLWD